MGQALRRATGRVRSSNPPPPSPPPPPEVVKNAARRPPEGVAESATSASVQDHVGSSDPDDLSRIKAEGDVLEERDPGYDAMLNKMVGRITSKPGGRLEMGEAFIVEKYNRPMPKLRSSKAEVEGSEQKSAPPGTLNAAQVQEIIRMYQGKSDEHPGPLGIHDIANKFRIDATHIERIVQFISLPPENNSKNTQQ